MRVTVRDHQGKAWPFAGALQAAGHDIVRRGGDVLLIDHDAPFGIYAQMLERHDRAVLYPHGGGVNLDWDGIYEPHPHVVCQLVIGEGQAEVLRAYDYPVPTRVVGWPWCEQLPFRPTSGERVLFAPMHPDANGYLSFERRVLNFEVFRALHERVLTVRHLGTLAANGLPAVQGVRYVRAGWLPEVDDIDAADVVVTSEGTFASLAIARGKPTVVYGQDIQHYAERPGDPTRLYASRWPEYRHLHRYPYDLDDIDRACTTEATEWRERFIGNDLDPAAVVSAVEEAACVPT